MGSNVKFMPQGYHSVTPCLSLKDTRKAIEFYKKAFGAKELGVFPTPDGRRTMHAVIQIGNSIVMMGDEMPEQGCKSAETVGASPIGLYVYVENADTVYNQAVWAGAMVAMPVADMFWGDRCGTVTDPFGYSWTVATHTRDMTSEDIKEGAEAFYAAAAPN